MEVPDNYLSADGVKFLGLLSCYLDPSGLALTRPPRANANYDPNRALNAGLRGGVYQKSSLLFGSHAQLFADGQISGASTGRTALDREGEGPDESRAGPRQLSL